MTSKGLHEDSIVIHKYLLAPRPLAVSNDEDALKFLGIPHKRHTYAKLGVAVTDLPDRRFAVLVADVEEALRARGVRATKPTNEASDVDADALEAAALSGLVVR